jgi:hypothetical protein
MGDYLLARENRSLVYQKLFPVKANQVRISENFWHKVFYPHSYFRVKKEDLVLEWDLFFFAGFKLIFIFLE